MERTARNREEKILNKSSRSEKREQKKRVEENEGKKVERKVG